MTGAFIYAKEIGTLVWGYWNCVLSARSASPDSLFFCPNSLTVRSTTNYSPWRRPFKLSNSFIIFNFDY